MSNLGEWLRQQIERRGLTQNAAAVYAGIGPATISDIINRGHIPRVDTLFRLADYFDVSHDLILELAGHLPVKRLDHDPEIEAQARALAEKWARIKKYAPEQLETLMMIASIQAELILAAARASAGVESKPEERENTAVTS